MADGFLDGLLGLMGGSGGGAPGADAATAQAYGITPDMMSANRYGTLGQIGAILLAAGQPGPVGQRGQMLAQLANVPGSANKSLMNAAQARLMGMKVQDEQDTRSRREQAKQLIAGLPGLTDEQRAWAVANPDQFLQSRGENSMKVDAFRQQTDYRNSADLAQRKLTDPMDVAKNAALNENQLKLFGQENDIRNRSAVEQRKITDPMDIEKSAATQASAANATFDAKVKELVGSGVPEDLARGFASGRYVSKVMKDDMGRETFGVFDQTTGKLVGGTPPASASLNPDQQKLVSPMPTQSADDPNKPLDYSKATGIPGMGAHAMNMLKGQFFDMPFSDAQRATEAMQGLATRTMTQMTAAIPGRETNEMRKQLGDLAVTPNSMTEPAPVAYGKLTQTKAVIDAEQQRLTTQLAGGGLTAQQRGAVRANIVQLQQLSKDYGVVIGHFDPNRFSPQSVANGGGAIAGGMLSAPGANGVRQYVPRGAQ